MKKLIAKIFGLYTRADLEKRDVGVRAERAKYYQTVLDHLHQSGTLLPNCDLKMPKATLVMTKMETDDGFRVFLGFITPFFEKAGWKWEDDGSVFKLSDENGKESRVIRYREIGPLIHQGEIVAADGKWKRLPADGEMVKITYAKS